jgi:hypothetical protein
MHENNYPLLENCIDELNEHTFIAAQLMTMAYYRKNYPKSSITVHIHQNTKAEEFVKIIDDLYNLSFGKPAISFSYRTDDPTYKSENYEDTEILVSLSQCAGLDPEIPPGALILPKDFIPYNIRDKTVLLSNKYSVPNDLNNTWKLILEDPLFEKCNTIVNTNYKSANKTKINHRVDIINVYHADVLQVTDLWEPVDQTELVQLK